MTLSYACRDMNDDKTVDESLRRYGLAPSTLPQLLVDLFEGFNIALSAARWLNKPQMRVLYALSLMMTTA